MATAETYPVRVLFERQAMDHPWQDHAWRVIGVVPAGEQAGAPAGLVHREEGAARYLSDVLDVSLFRKETAGYKENLSQPVPQVYAVLRPVEDGDDGADVGAFHVTVCPHEAGSYAEGDESIVGGTPMPEPLRAWVQAFVDAHHVDVPFKKRKRDRSEKEEVRGWGRPPSQGH